jgi:hypothetical protein
VERNHAEHRCCGECKLPGAIRAIVQLAVYEAVNAITGDMNRTSAHQRACGTAEAAAIAAAYRTLVSLFPSRPES